MNIWIEFFLLTIIIYTGYDLSKDKGDTLTGNIETLGITTIAGIGTGYYAGIYGVDIYNHLYEIIDKVTGIKGSGMTLDPIKAGNVQKVLIASIIMYIIVMIILKARVLLREYLHKQLQTDVKAVYLAIKAWEKAKVELLKLEYKETSNGEKLQRTTEPDIGEERSDIRGSIEEEVQ